MINTINGCRKWCNSKEELLSGQIQDSVFESMTKAQIQTKFPADLLAFMMDWDNDITSGGGNAMSVAMQGIGYVNQLRSMLGRDPMHAEIFGAHCLKSAALLKKVKDLAEQKPEEEAQPLGGGKKQNIIYKKLRNGKEVKRVNREVYDFFYKRVANGKMSLKMNLGNSDAIQSILQGSGNSELLSAFTGSIGV